ncbi:MAG: hypothetical protein IT308_12570 [Anaerolineaceae bacterium]|nr:hypothetical protein [Anaerolineaceae bacterium]
MEGNKASCFFRRTWLLWVSGYFTLLTVGMTWPLAAHMQTKMVGQLGDNIYFVWMIAWIKKALFELHVNPFNIWFLNYPEGWNMAYTEITPAQLALAMPFSFAGGPMFAYNAAMMASFILSGLFMFLWVRRLTGNSTAALVAGTLYAFLPFRFAHFLIGHLNLSGTQWFPLFFWGFFEILGVTAAAEEKKITWKYAVLAGLGLGLIGLTSQYYLYMTVLITGLIFLAYGFFINRKVWKRAAIWKRMGVMAVVSFPLIFLAVLPYLQLSQAGGLPDRSLSLVRPYSASPTDFLLPSTDHFLWGKWVGDHFNRQMWVEGTLYIGAVTLVLTMIAWFKRKALGKRSLLTLLLAGAGFSILLAMGTDLHWNGQPVEIPAPAFLAEKLGREQIPLLLPGYFLFKYFPFYAKLRALMRFGVFALIFFTASAGMGAAWLLEKTRASRKNWLAIGLLLMVFMDFYPGTYREFTQVLPRPVDLWLAQQPGEGAVIQFPFVKGEDQEHTYFTLFHGKPYVGGFFNAFPPPQYQKIKPVMENFPDLASVSLLKALGVEYILVDMASYPNLDTLRRECDTLGLVLVGQYGDQLVFQPED